MTAFGWSRVAEDQQPGGSSGAEAVAAEFSSTYTTVTDDYRERMSAIQATGREALNAGDQDAVLAVYAELRDASQAAADRFRAVDAPDQLRDDQQRLVENLDQQSQTLTRVLAAAAAQNQDELSGGLSDLATLLVDFAAINQTIDQELAQGP